MTCQACYSSTPRASAAAARAECLFCHQRREAARVIIPWWRELMYAPGSSYVRHVLEARFDEMRQTGEEVGAATEVLESEDCKKTHNARLHFNAK